MQCDEKMDTVPISAASGRRAHPLSAWIRKRLPRRAPPTRMGRRLHHISRQNPPLGAPFSPFDGK